MKKTLKNILTAGAVLAAGAVNAQMHMPYVNTTKTEVEGNKINVSYSIMKGFGSEDIAMVNIYKDIKQLGGTNLQYNEGTQILDGDAQYDDISLVSRGENGECYSLPLVNSQVNLSFDIDKDRVVDWNKNGLLQVVGFSGAQNYALIELPVVDTTTNGVSHAWQDQYDLVPAGANNFLRNLADQADPDGDKRTNLNEWLNGTNPMKFTSKKGLGIDMKNENGRIKIAPKLEDSVQALTAEPAEGNLATTETTYFLEHAPTLQDNWSVIATNNTPFFNIEPAGDQGFFRSYQVTE